MYWENTRTPVRGKSCRSFSAARSPSSLCVGGIRMSTTATSGRCSATAASSASPSAITTRITQPPSGLHRQHDGHHGRAAGRAGHVDPPVYGGDALHQSGEPAAPGHVRAADAVVADVEAEHPGPFGTDVYRDLVRKAVLGRVG